MRHMAIRWYFGSKSECWEHFVTVIVLDDLADSLQCHSVCIELVRIHVVKGSRLRGISCQREKESQNTVHLEAAKLRGNYAMCKWHIARKMPHKLHVLSWSMQFVPVCVLLSINSPSEIG